MAMASAPTFLRVCSDTVPPFDTWDAPPAAYVSPTHPQPDSPRAAAAGLINRAAIPLRYEEVTLVMRAMA